MFKYRMLWKTHYLIITLVIIIPSYHGVSADNELVATRDIARADHGKKTGATLATYDLPLQLQEYVNDTVTHSFIPLC